MATISKYANAHTAITTGYTNPSNAYANDANYATAAPAKNTTVGAYFGFAGFTTGEIPDGSTINSVTVKLEYYLSTTSSIPTQGIQVFVNTSGVGTEQTSTASPTSDTALSHQVTSGVTLANLRSADVVRAYTRSSRGNTNTAVTFYIKYLEITVDYTAPTGHTHNASDTATASDNISTSVAYSRSLSDSVTASDDNTRVKIIEKELADSVTASDNQTQVKTFQRTIADSITPSDNQTQVKTFQRTLADSVTPSDNLSTAKTMNKSLSDSVTASESTSIFSSNSMSGKIALLAKRIGQECKAIWNALAGKSDTNHTHTGVYEPAISKSTGYLRYTGSTWQFLNETYSLSTHNHDGTYQPLDADLTSIANLGFTASALLRKTAANTWTLDTATYLTGNQSITISGDATGSGSTSISLTITGLRGVALPTLATGYLRYTGSAWAFLNETYLTAITKVMVENVLTGLITSHTHNYEAVISKATGYLTWDGSAWVWKNETYSLSAHNHAGMYEVPLTFSTGLNRATNTITVVYGTAAGTACVGNDARLSDTRTPSDATVTYAKLANDLTSRNTVAAANIDWNAGGVFTKTITGATTFTFSNLQLNKVITLVMTGNFAITLPTYCKKISGTYTGTVSNYIQFHCTNATGGSEEVWYTINQQAT